MSDGTQTRQVEAERRYQVPASQLDCFYRRAREAGLNDPRVLHLNTVYLPRQDDVTSQRLRIERDVKTGVKRFLHGTKTKIQGNNGVKWKEGVKFEDEPEIDESRYTTALRSQTTGAASNGRMPGNYKHSLAYMVTFEGLEVNVYLDVVTVTYDGRSLPPMLEVEALVSSVEEGERAIPILERLAVLLLGPSPTPITRSCRRMSEPPEGLGGLPSADAKPPGKEKGKKKKKKKKSKK